MRPKRTCPICDKCGSKKFKIIENQPKDKKEKEKEKEKIKITIQCLTCDNILNV